MKLVFERFRLEIVHFWLRGEGVPLRLVLEHFHYLRPTLRLLLLPFGGNQLDLAPDFSKVDHHGLINGDLLVLVEEVGVPVDFGTVFTAEIDEHDLPWVGNERGMSLRDGYFLDDD